MAELLQFARQRPKSSRARSQSLQGPAIALAVGAIPAVTAAHPTADLAVQPQGQPEAGARQHVSVGSLSPHPPIEACDIINVRRAEDGHVRIERRRRQWLEAAAEADPQEAGQAALDYGGGCLALAPALRQLNWPRKFHPNMPKKYDGTTNPKEFLQVYSTAMVTAEADAKIMANWFSMALKPATLSWLMHLLKGSIKSWADLCEQFVNAFQGG